MIIGDIETTEKVEYEDLLKNYYEKMEIIEEQDKEIERLHTIIKEVRELLKNDYFEDGSFTSYKKVFELLDKESK